MAFKVPFLSHLIGDLARASSRYGIKGAADYAGWRIRTIYEKFRIRFEERFNLFSYAAWVKAQKKDSPFSQGHLTSSDQASPSKPAVSFLIYSRVLDPQSIEEMQPTLESIQMQASGDWECIIFCPGEEYLRGQEKLGAWLSDPRIFLQSADGIADKNSAIIASLPFLKGKWLVWTRQGDTFDSNLLSRLAGAEGEIVYWDEDRIVFNKSYPFFKPDWSPELWLSVDLLYCSAFQIEPLKKLADKGSSTQLIASSVASAQRIAHLPEILTHCTASAWENQTEAVGHRIDVLEYLKLKGIPNPQVFSGPDGSLKVTGQASSLKISIIIPNTNSFQFLQTCIQSILENTDHEAVEIIVVDGASTDERVKQYYRQLQEKIPAFKVVEGSAPFNFSKACNLGAQAASGDLLLFLNNDIKVLSPDWLKELAFFASMDEIGIVGAKLLYPDRTIQHAGIVLGLEGHASHVFGGAPEAVLTPYGSPGWYRNYSAVTGACMMMRKQIFQEIGGFDGKFILAFGDVDLCLRCIEQGYRVMVNPEAILIHYEGQSRGKLIPGEDIRTAYERFAGIVRKGDPFYNNSLSLAVRLPTFKRSWEQRPIDRLQQIVKYKSL